MLLTVSIGSNFNLYQGVAVLRVQEVEFSKALGVPGIEFKVLIMCRKPKRILKR